WRFYATGVCLALVNLVMAWDATAISIALPTIAVALNGSSVSTFWLGISFFIAATAFIPLYSVFAEIFGRKAVLLAGLTLFIIGSLVTAISPDMGTALLGRSIQGIGAGGVFVLSDLIVTDLVSPLDKRRWSAVLGLVWAIGALTGPAVGEALAEQSQWRWIFWLNLPFGISSLLVLAFFAKLKATKYGDKIYEIKQIDWAGFVLMTGSLISILLGISWGGTSYAWSSPRTLIPIQFGLIGIILFCVWSWFAPFQSMISIDGFMDLTSLGMYFGTMIQGCIIGAFVFFMPLYFGVAQAGTKDLPAGVRWLPWTVPLVILIFATFIVISRWNAWLYAIWLGWFLLLLGIAMTTFYSRTSSDGMLGAIAVVVGSGIGILFPSLHTASELIAGRERDDEKQRRAVTNTSWFHYMGRSFGVALATCIFENRLFRHLDTNDLYHNFARVYANDSVSLLVRIRATPGGQGSAKVMIADMYVQSLKSVWISMAVLAGLALLASCFMLPRVPKEEKEAEMRNLDGGYAV
ncbi:MFS general substrate transporter, partial [Bimuria novae-zelandiae CBS 107.79]